MPNCFLVFDSIHHVLTAEREFLRHSVWCDLVPTPRSIDSDCGMVVQARTDDLPSIMLLIRELMRKPRGIYQLVNGEYRVIHFETSLK